MLVASSQLTRIQHARDTVYRDSGGQLMQRGNLLGFPRVEEDRRAPSQFGWSFHFPDQVRCIVFGPVLVGAPGAVLAKIDPRVSTVDRLSRKSTGNGQFGF